MSVRARLLIANVQNPADRLYRRDMAPAIHEREPFSEPPKYRHAVDLGGFFRL